jgi:hypothetical protein
MASPAAYIENLLSGGDIKGLQGFRGHPFKKILGIGAKLIWENAVVIPVAVYNRVGASSGIGWPRVHRNPVPVLIRKSPSHDWEKSSRFGHRIV